MTFWQSHNFPQNEQSIIICDPELMQTQWLIKQVQKVGIQYDRMITSCSLEVIANLTSQGLGVGIIPSRVARSITPSLKKLPNMPSFHDEIYLVYRNENRYIKAIQVIAQEIKIHLKKIEI